MNAKRIRGFNAIFATASIDAARMYYTQFKLSQQDLPPDRRAKIGIIFSYGANDASDDGILDDEAFDTDSLAADARTFLEGAIGDYNEMFRNQLRHEFGQVPELLQGPVSAAKEPRA